MMAVGCGRVFDVVYPDHHPPIKGQTMIAGGKVIGVVDSVQRTKLTLEKPYSGAELIDGGTVIFENNAAAGSAGSAGSARSAGPDVAGGAVAGRAVAGGRSVGAANHDCPYHSSVQNYRRLWPCGWVLLSMQDVEDDVVSE